MCEGKTSSVVLYDVVHRLSPGVLCFQHVVLFCGKRVVEKNNVPTTYWKYSRLIILLTINYCYFNVFFSLRKKNVEKYGKIIFSS